jgi:predicted deacylase
MGADAVRIGDVACPPGSKARGLIEVAKGPDGHPMGIPVLVVNGALPGSRLCIAAGIHGDEYEGMEAVRRLVEELDPRTLRGAVIGLPCVNPPAFQAAARSSGVDHLNLNRIFPGDKNGSLSMRWAAAFVTEVIPHIDALVDLHTGGGFGLIAPCTIVQAGYEPLTMDLGLAVGHELIWKGGTWGGTARISTLEAGKPAITVEAGGGGGCREETIVLHLQGLRNAMRHFKLVDGVPETLPEYKEIRGTFALASCGGFFRAEAAPGQAVRQNDPIGAIVNHWGDTLELIRAPRDGLVLWIRWRSTIFPGEEAVIFAEVVGRIKP